MKTGSITLKKKDGTLYKPAYESHPVVIYSCIGPMHMLCYQLALMLCRYYPDHACVNSLMDWQMVYEPKTWMCVVCRVNRPRVYCDETEYLQLMEEYFQEKKHARTSR